MNEEQPPLSSGVGLVVDTNSPNSMRRISAKKAAYSSMGDTLSDMVLYPRRKKEAKDTKQSKVASKSGYVYLNEAKKEAEVHMADKRLPAFSLGGGAVSGGEEEEEDVLDQSIQMLDELHQNEQPLRMSSLHSSMPELSKQQQRGAAKKARKQKRVSIAAVPEKSRSRTPSLSPKRNSEGSRRKMRDSSSSSKSGPSRRMRDHSDGSNPTRKNRDRSKSKSGRSRTISPKRESNTRSDMDSSSRKMRESTSSKSSGRRSKTLSPKTDKDKSQRSQRTSDSNSSRKMRDSSSRSRSSHHHRPSIQVSPEDAPTTDFEKRSSSSKKMRDSSSRSRSSHHRRRSVSPEDVPDIEKRREERRLQRQMKSQSEPDYLWQEGRPNTRNSEPAPSLRRMDTCPSGSTCHDTGVSPCPIRRAATSPVPSSEFDKRREERRRQRKMKEEPDYQWQARQEEDEEEDECPPPLQRMGTCPTPGSCSHDQEPAPMRRTATSPVPPNRDSSQRKLRKRASAEKKGRSLTPPTRTSNHGRRRRSVSVPKGDPRGLGDLRRRRSVSVPKQQQPKMLSLFLTDDRKSRSARTGRRTVEEEEDMRSVASSRSRRGRRRRGEAVDDDEEDSRSSASSRNFPLRKSDPTTRKERQQQSSLDVSLSSLSSRNRRQRHRRSVSLSNHARALVSASDRQTNKVPKSILSRGRSAESTASCSSFPPCEAKNRQTKASTAMGAPLGDLISMGGGKTSSLSRRLSQSAKQFNPLDMTITIPTEHTWSDGFDDDDDAAQEWEKGACGGCGVSEEPQQPIKDTPGGGNQRLEDDERSIVSSFSTASSMTSATARSMSVVVPFAQAIPKEHMLAQKRATVKREKDTFYQLPFVSAFGDLYDEDDVSFLYNADSRVRT